MTTKTTCCCDAVCVYTAILSHRDQCLKYYLTLPLAVRLMWLEVEMQGRKSAKVSKCPPKTWWPEAILQTWGSELDTGNLSTGKLTGSEKKNLLYTTIWVWLAFDVEPSWKHISKLVRDRPGGRSLEGDWENDWFCLRLHKGEDDMSLIPPSGQVFDPQNQLPPFRPTHCKR